MKKELTSLESNFDLVLQPTSIKGAMKAQDASSKDLWMVDPANLKIIEGYNVRVMTDKYKETIRRYADSMLANGWIPNSVLNGYAAIDDDGDQVIYVTAGHTRLLALELANSEGADIHQVPITVGAKGIAMDDLQVELIQGNEANPLTLYEKGIVCKRLLQSGYTTQEIERRTGVKNPLLSKVLVLMSAPYKLRELVAYEKVSASFAIEMIEKHGNKALEIVQSAIDKAVATGSKKVTKKHTEGSAVDRYIKKSAPILYSTLESVTRDDGYTSLSFETKKAIEELFASVPK